MPYVPGRAAVAFKTAAEFVTATPKTHIRTTAEPLHFQDTNLVGEYVFVVIVLTVLILAGKCETSPAVPELVVCSQSWIDILAQKGTFCFFSSMFVWN